MTNEEYYKLFGEYYGKWKKETQFAWEGHFENRWYKKIIEEIPCNIVLTLVYECISKRIDYIAYAADDAFKKKYGVKLTKLKKGEKENEYIPLEDYCERVKLEIKNLMNKK